MIEQCAPMSLSLEDLEMLMQATELVEESKGELISKIADGSSIVWRVSSDTSNGLLVTFERNGFLFVWHFVGVNMHATAKEVVAHLKKHALHRGLEGVRAETGARMTSVLEHMGFNKVRSVMEWRHDGRE